MSTYIPDSELSLINKSKPNLWLNTSPELADVINAALAFNQLCEGDYDVTVGPLVNIWGFGPEQWPEKVPTKKANRRS
jgi:thiamine biosynthesis lipoprotein